MKYKIPILTLLGLAVLAAVVGIIHVRTNDTGCCGQDALRPLAVTGAAVPAGWYQHDLSYPNAPELVRSIILTRQKQLPDVGATEGGAYGEQIDINISTTSLSAEAYTQKQGLTGPNADAMGIKGTWGIFEGHKMFTTTLEMGATVILFGGNQVDSFISNYPEDSGDFWRVITYYAHDPSFGKVTQ